nr:hypothetical protein [Gardnerella vaginalis]
MVDAKRAGSIPVVDRERLPKHVYNMLAATAGMEILRLLEMF